MDVCAGHQGGEGEQLPRSGSRRCGHTSSAATGKACTASWRVAWERTAAATVRAMPQAVVSDVENLNCACRSVDYLLSRQLEDGNFPQLASDQEKHVVHWCHGAPGLTALCCEAFRAFNDSKYLAIARRCCDVCWHRGILKKGFGLCHGIAGNAYSFLFVCRIEGADTESMVASKQYRRASCFARILVQPPRTSQRCPTCRDRFGSHCDWIAARQTALSRRFRRFPVFPV